MKNARWMIPPLAGVAVYLLLAQFETTQRLIGAIFAVTVALWMTELLPLAMTALLSTCLLIAVGGIKEKEAFAAYGDPIIPLFIGSFILSKAMEKSGLSDRFAYYLLGRPWATKSPGRLLFTLGLIACLISLFVSNTATTAMLLPIGLSMLGTLQSEIKPFAVAVMLMLTWASSIAVGVPVGTPPNLIGIGLIEKATGRQISFLEWMTFGMPITVLMLLGCGGILWLLYRCNAPAAGEARELAVVALREKGPMSHAERNTLFAFTVAVALWILPDLSAVLLGSASDHAKALQAAVPASVAALVAACLLFALPTRDGSQKMNWETARTINWGIILLFAGGIALGQAMFSSGLAKGLGELAASVTGANTVWTITALCIFCAIVLSELASNTAAATTLVPVAIGLAQGAGVSPIPPALGVALGASLGFMLPVSTAPNAIVYASGLVPPREMMKAGLLIDVLGFFVTLLCLWLILPRMGLA